MIGNEIDYGIDNIYIEKIKKDFSKIFEKYGKFSIQSNSIVLTKMALSTMLQNANVFNEDNKFFVSKYNFDLMYNEKYPTVKEIYFELFIDILIKVMKMMYCEIFDSYTYNSIIAFSRKFNVINADCQNSEEQTIFDSIVNKINSTFEEIDDETKDTLYEIDYTLRKFYSFYIDSIYNKKEYEIYDGLVLFCKNFKILPYIFKQTEFDLYYFVKIEKKDYFTFEDFLTFFVDLSDFYNIKKINKSGQKELLSQKEKIDNFLFYLHQTEYLKTFITLFQDPNKNENLFLIPKTPTLSSKKQTIQSDSIRDKEIRYVNLIKANLFKLREMFILYNENNSLFELGKMNFSSFSKFIIELGLIKSHKIYNSSKATIEKASCRSTISNNKYSIIESNLNDSTTCYTQKNRINYNYSLSKEDVNLLFNQITKNKIFTFQHFIISIEKIIEKIENKKKKDSEFYSNFMNEIIFPFMHKKKQMFKRKNNEIYSLVSKNKLYNNQTIFCIFKDIFSIFYINYCNDKNYTISLKKFVQFFQHYSFVPLFVNVDMLKSIFCYFLFESNVHNIDNYEITFDDFVNSVMIIALLYKDQENMSFESKIKFLIQFFDKIRKEKNVLLTNKDVNINYNHNEIHNKVGIMIKKLYKELKSVCVKENN